jgi:AraC-like DNA-binding protein
MYAYLGYKGMFQSQILMPDFLLEKMSISKIDKDVIPKDEQQKPQTVQGPKQLDTFSQDEIERLKARVIELLEKDKLYLNESLSLTEMATCVGISNKKLSELLNQHLNTNFYNLVNDYRVNEVKERLKDCSDKFTLVSIAYDSGFQSKASFNRIFKQKTGMSPALYRKNLR